MSELKYQINDESEINGKMSDVYHMARLGNARFDNLHPDVISEMREASKPQPRKQKSSMAEF